MSDRSLPLAIQPAAAPLLMIPGPVELSPAVRAAAALPPPSHTSARLIEAFAACLDGMRRIWRAGPSGQPFLIAGSGTVAMEMAAANLVEPGDRVLVIDTGYFAGRMAEILRRNGAEVMEVGAPVGEVPPLEVVRAALAGIAGAGPCKALFVTHVDTSTGVRVDPEPLCRLAREAGALAVFDGVCAAAGERFDMAGWGADLYFTGSQKALGVPPGLALLVAGERALAARAARRAAPPPLYLDWDSWLPIHRAYEERRPSYFATPATSLVLALEAGLAEILSPGADGVDGIERRVADHARAAAALRAAWSALGLRPVPRSPEAAANTLSALYFPASVDAALLPRIAARGVTVAGGLHPEIRATSFRVGHMGWVVTQPDLLRRTVDAVAGALYDLGAEVNPEAAGAAFEAVPRAGAGPSR
ncbi:MAG TPA: aminotransferase class V-fold PLP-dependent enzyme [Thermoanaerobaculia bacterium]|nr:aminotransferase class V-fold PLP-dependent enzyme [Thermoanaerobaculia bacterium]